MADLARHIVEAFRRQSSESPITTDTETAVRREVRALSEQLLATGVEFDIHEEDTARRVLHALTGLGPLQPLLDDPTVEEIWINAPDAVFFARDGRTVRAQIRLSAEEVETLVERCLAHTGRRVDLSQPFVDASLPDGSRLHVVIPTVTRAHWSVNIRKFHRNMHSLDALTERAMLSADAATFLRAAVSARLNILVSGPTHAGKTTLLNALIQAGPATDRVVTVEETFELNAPVADVVAMQCRPANLEGAGEITLRRLVKEALRMRPDRLIVGEVREAESLDLLIALNSGVAGLATIHANSARDAVLKLSTLPLLAGPNITANFIVATVASTLDLVVHCERLTDGSRVVSHIVALTGSQCEGQAESTVVFARTASVPADLVYTGVVLPQADSLAQHGCSFQRFRGAA